MRNVFQVIHQLDVYHGDVRKENILVREDDSVVVIDYEGSDVEEPPMEVLEMEQREVEALLRELKKETIEG